MLRRFHNSFPEIDPTAFIAETAVIIGDVRIGAESGIWYNCVVRGDVNFIRIGARTNIQDQCVLHVTHRKTPDDPGAPLVIGSGVTVAHAVTLHGCTLEDGCFVGMNAVVMDGAVVGEGALVAAGALVTERTVIPPRTLWVGSPARYKRDLNDAEIARLKKSAENYVRYAAQYLQG
jgi:carbonic anhydrase/acetyltransferase-like protein (isoleucine patch superfamily)